MVAHIPPQYLYRYRPANTDYFEEEITRAVHKREIFLSGLTDANDPFEALPYLADNSLKEVRDYLARFEKLFGKGVAITGTDYGKVVEQEGYSKRKLRDIIGPSLKAARRTVSSLKGSIADMRKQIKIACFSERWDSLLMWSHYGQSHKGICVEYAPKILIGAREGRAPLAMDYSDQRPTVSLLDLLEHTGSSSNENKDNFFDLDRAQRTFNSIAMTKPREWEYELEWRVMDIGDATAGYFYVASLEPTAILLGANHSPKTLKQIQEIVAGKVDIEMISLDRERFTLRRSSMLHRL